MNQHTVNESKRVLSILDELIEDIELLSYLPGYLISFPQTDLDYMSTVNGAQMGRVYNQTLRNFFDLENKVQGTSVSPEEAADHHGATRKVLDTFRATGYGKDYRPNTNRSEAVLQFLEVMQVLKSIYTHKFNTTAEEERQKMEILQAAMHREADASADVEALKREFTSEKMARRQEVQKKDAAINKLQEELAMVRETAAQSMSAYRQSVSEQNAADAHSFEQEEANLHAEIKRLTQESGTIKDKDTKDENSRRHDRQKRENKVQAVIDQYDAQMAEDTATLKNLLTEKQQHEEQYRKVEKELDELRELHQKADMEDQTEAHRQNHKMEMSFAMEENIRMVQAFYRSYAVRVIQQRKKKGKKK